MSRIPVLGFALGVLSFSFLSAATSHAQGREPLVAGEQTQLFAFDGGPEDGFGNRMAVSGNTLVVGARWAVTNDVEMGAVYVFVEHAGEWTLQARLTPPLGSDGDRFGTDVAISRDLLLVGAPGDDGRGGDAGAVHAFGRAGNGWIHIGKLVASDGETLARFGARIDIDRDRAVIGARGDSTNAANGGGAYVFEWSVSTGWVQRAKLEPSVAQQLEFFGADVALDGEVVLIGAHGLHVDGQPRGGAYVFRHDAGSWSLDTVLVDEEGSLGDAYGTVVDVVGRTAVVGAMYADGRAGAVHVYERGSRGWDATQRLVASDGESFDQFGASLALDDWTLLVGAPFADTAGESSGSAYLFVRGARGGSGWTESDELSAAHASAGDRLGIAVVVEDQVAVVAAPGQENEDSPGVGAAVVFRLARPVGTFVCYGDGSGESCPCANDSDEPGRGCLHSGGIGMELVVAGSASIAADDLELTAHFAPRDEIGFFFVGTESIHPGAGLHDGLSCVGGEGHRFGVQLPAPEAPGISTDTGFVAQEGSGLYFLPGGSYVFQYFSRDIVQGWSPCGGGANFSPAVVVVMTP